jgi:hypothetical protein
MFNSYKEIVYGVMFGLAAALLDTALDARAENQSVPAEIGGHPAMMLYRMLFVLLGWFIGWLLWRDNKRERDFRQMMEEMRRFHHEYEAQAIVLHTNLQLLLTKNLQIAPEDQALLRSTYENSRDLQTLAKQRPAV